MNYQILLDRLRRADDLSAMRLRATAAARAEKAAAVPLRDRLTRVRRAWLVIAGWVAICVGLAGFYCFQAEPKFLVTTDVVLEPPQPSLSTDPVAQSTTPTLDSALADSQVQVLLSERNLRYVFDVQHLDSDPEFAGSGFDPIGWILSLLPFPAEPPLSAEEQAKRNREIAFQNFASQVSAKRLAQSYAFELSFYANSPAKAARLGNAITAAYIRDKVLYNIAAAAAQRGGDFLKNRVADTKAEQEAADNAVRTGVIPDFVFGHADARIISSAVEPLRKAYPKTTLILLMAFFFALTTGVAGAVVVDELDPRVRSARRLWALTGLTALAALPVVKRARQGPSALLQWARTDPESRFASEIRKLRGVTLQLAGDGAPPSIGVLSYRRGEGRSVVAANLAALIAASGTPTALIDSDILNPALTRSFAPQAPRGLADSVSAGVDPSYLLHAVAPNFSVLPARSLATAPDPNETVGFTMTVGACAALSRSHFVVVDLPPVSDSPESLAVAGGLSGIIVIVDAARVAVDELLQLIDRLADTDARVLGVAINRSE